MSELRDNRPDVGTCVELFAGAGGLAMGVHNAGFRPLLVNEYAKRAVETLQTNEMPGGGAWPLKPGDVRDLVDDFKKLEGKVDILAGGPPCQPFSLGGAHKGVEDERNMFPQMFRAIREMKPSAVICENVRGLLRPSFKPYFDYILNELRLPFVEREPNTSWEDHNELLEKLIANDAVPASERYVVKPVPVNAADFGVPQIRQRVIIVAFRADLDVDWEKFEPKPAYSEEALIHSMREGGEYWSEGRHADVDGEVKKRVIANLPLSIMRMRRSRRSCGSIRGVRSGTRSRASTRTRGSHSHTCRSAPWRASSRLAPSKTTSDGPELALTRGTPRTSWTGLRRP